MKSGDGQTTTPLHKLAPIARAATLRTRSLPYWMIETDTFWTASVS